MFLCGELQCIKGKLDLILWDRGCCFTPRTFYRIVEFTLWMRSGLSKTSHFCIRPLYAPVVWFANCKLYQ